MTDNEQMAGTKPKAPRKPRRWLRRLGYASATLSVAAVAGWFALDHWVETADIPELDRDVSVTVLDRKGRLLRAYQVDDGRWRLPVTVADVDPDYIAQLLAYEDSRFYSHSGVDLLALVRHGIRHLSRSAFGVSRRLR